VNRAPEATSQRGSSVAWGPGVGKTSLPSSVATLDGWGVRVGLVKHSCHAVPVDRPGKDSHRLYGAGAAAVALAMPGQIATFQRTAKRRPKLHEAIATLPPDLDAILVEGFHWEPIRATWCWRTIGAPAALQPRAGWCSA
jgi:molybdopterin-guanine dinucleotide biosynthesis protein MobB